MKKALTIGFVLLALGAVGLIGMTWMGKKANDDALAKIKEQPGVIVLGVEGMT